MVVAPIALHSHPRSPTPWSLPDQYTSQPRSTLVPPRPVHQPTQIHPGPSQTSTPANPDLPWSLPDQYTSQPRSTLVPPRPVHQPTQIHPGPSQTSRPNFQRELAARKDKSTGQTRRGKRNERARDKKAEKREKEQETERETQRRRERKNERKTEKRSVAAGSIPQQQASSGPPGPINTSGPLSA
ncbi:unnamed protein product [Arctogadus glacialis]